MRLSFDGPVLLLGGGCTLGLAVAAALRAEGAAVLAVCGSEAGRQACTGAGLPVEPLGEAESLPGRCARRLGALPGHLLDLRHSRREHLLAGMPPAEIDAWAAEDIALRARILRAVTRAMLSRRSGRCVFVSSSAALRPSPGQGWYAAAKLAGEALFRSAGAELAGRGVTACSARLSWLDAGRGREFLAHDGAARRAASAMPAGRLLRLEEAVGPLTFLLSREAAGINACTVDIDGGLGAVKLMEGA
ncbi:SDR family oxidoreductase [uncultured Desulfovibrio sp.]|uniref:SDR family NAD(P)-dependent oxidoreductase n=2 Tax=uncultured Desulfovibrio sp. TaxID=167968 RepID=UPI00320A31A4